MPRIKNSQPISTILIGGRKIGKSSLLYEINRRLAGQSSDTQTYISTYVNFQSVNNLSPTTIFAKIIEAIVSSLKKTTGTALDLPSLGSGDPYAEFCIQLWDIWNHCSATLGDVRFVVLIDEADRLLKHDWTTDVVGNLRDLINTSDLRFFISLVITGFRELHDYAVVEAAGMGSVLGNAAYWTSLGVLTEHECRHLITEPLHGDLSELVVQTVHDRSGGHPFITQYLMHQIWDHDLDSITDTRVEEAANTFSSQVKLFVSWEDRFTEWDTKVYCTLASLGGFSKLETLYGRLVSKGNMGALEDALDFLCYAGVVGKQDGQFWIAGRLFCDWFLRRHPDDAADKLSLQHRLEVALENLSVIEEAETDYVEPKDVPLNLRLAKRRLQRLVAELQMKLDSASQTSRS